MKLVPVRGSSCKHPLILIRWVVIYSVDSAIQRLNNQGQNSKFWTQEKKNYRNEKLWNFSM